LANSCSIENGEFQGMTKYRVVCTEEVETEFVVDAPDGETLNKWMDSNEAIDFVSEHTHLQTVIDREFRPYTTGNRAKADVTLERK